MIEVVNFKDIPPPPYQCPDSPTKVLSLSMTLEQICRTNRFFGLSAPQIGIPYPIFVYWSNCPNEPRVFSCLVEPSYSGMGGKDLSFETCPSFPDHRFGIMRYSDIMVSAKQLDIDTSGRILFKDVEFEASGLKAAILQHEADHIIGTSLESAERISFK